MVAVQGTQASNAAKRGAQEKIALVGNPNVGKSAIFNALTGLNADVSNYPGTTIDVSRGKLRDDDLVDTPGIYGVSSFNDEERIARKMLLEADKIVNVISALSLERDLFLTLQLIDMQKHMVLVVNQWDEAKARNITIDIKRLELELGVPTITTVAVTGEGIADIAPLLDAAKQGAIQPEILALTDELKGKGISCDRALLIMEGDAATAAEHAVEVEHRRADIYKLRRERANSIVESVVGVSGKRKTLSSKLGRLLLEPVAGTVIAACVCYLLFYQLLGVIVAGKVVDITEKQGMRVYYEPNIRRLCANIFPVSITIADTKFAFPQGTLAQPDKAKLLEATMSKSAAADAAFDFWAYPSNFMSVFGNSLVGSYGVLTLTVTYLLGLLFPLVLAFYLGLSLLEDSGYLPRLAVLVDRLLNKIGLTGRAIIPLILGLGCVTMATVTTRLLSTRREKLIATALLGVAIPCSAQLGVVSGTLAKVGGLAPWITYGTVITSILIITGLALNKILPGKSGALMIDLPPMRLPRANNVLKKTWSKTWHFMLESIPMFALAGLVVSVADMTGLLGWFVKTLQPLTVGLLKLPDDPRIATTFILGIVRRDFAAFGLTDVNLSAAQAVVAMVVITLFVPCVATVGVMIKERGLVTALTIWIGSWLAAFVIGGALAAVLPGILALVHF